MGNRWGEPLSRKGWSRSIAVWFLILGTSVSALARATEYYVSVAGHDANPGSAELPFATIARARDAVRTLVASGLDGDVHVYIRSGTYRISEPLTFGIADSGTSTFAIRYLAEPGHRPVISGGQPIPVFSTNPNGTWSTVIADVASGDWTFRELFVNNQRRPRARHPNGGQYLRISSAAPNQRTTFQFTEGDIPETTDLAGAELVFFHDWSISRVAISGVNHPSNTLTTANHIGPSAPIYALTFFEQHPRYYVENDAALLDAPGEWYLDEWSGALTYWPMPGESIANVDVIAPRAEQLIIVRGVFESASSNPEFVQNLHFDGLHLAHSAWPLPFGGFAEYQAGFYEPRDGTPFYDLPAAVVFEQADGCSFQNGSVSHVGGWGIMAGRTTRHCAVVGNRVTDVAGNGLILGEDQFRNIRDINNNPLGAWYAVAPLQAAHGNIARNNLVEHCGKVFFGCVGIWVGITHDNEVAHNVVRHVPWSGISIGGFFDDVSSPCHDNDISFNHIHNVVEVMSDGGGIYTLGRQTNTVIAGNIIHEIPLQPGVSSNVGLFLDQGTTDIVYDQNAVFSIVRPPVKVHIAGVNTLSNNTFVRSSAAIPHILYINTAPGQLILQSNTTTTQNGPIGCGHPVYAVTPTAGLETPYLENLLGQPTSDGCASCGGVPYSGLFADSCGNCQGSDESCSPVPVVSQWALTIFVLLLVTAASVLIPRGFDDGKRQV